MQHRKKKQHKTNKKKKKKKHRARTASILYNDIEEKIKPFYKKPET